MATSHAPLGEMLELQAQLLLVGSLMTQDAAALEVQTQTQLARVARSAAAAARLARVTRAVQLQTQTQLARHPAAHVGPSVAP